MRRTIAWLLIRLASRILRWGTIVRPIPSGGVVVGVYADPSDREVLAKACQRLAAMGGFGGWAVVPEGVSLEVSKPSTIDGPPIWTDEECLKRNARQHNRHFHPYTCGNDSRHTPLIATRYGWRCADCGYTQH